MLRALQSYMGAQPLISPPSQTQCQWRMWIFHTGKIPGSHVCTTAAGHSPIHIPIMYSPFRLPGAYKSLHMVLMLEWLLLSTRCQLHAPKLLWVPILKRYHHTFQLLSASAAATYLCSNGTHPLPTDCWLPLLGDGESVMCFIFTILSVGTLFSSELQAGL